MRFVTILENEIYDRERADREVIKHKDRLERAGKGKLFVVKRKGGQRRSPYRVVLYQK